MRQIVNIRDFLLEEVRYCSRRQSFKKSSYGDKNEDKKFRVLCNRGGRFVRAQGLISTLFAILPNMIEARRYGYVPVVDLRMNSRNQIMLQEPDLAKKENAWEYYFTQPDKNITLEEVRQSRYVENQIKQSCNYNYYIGDVSPKSISKFKVDSLKWGIHQNIHLQPQIKKRVINEKHKIFLQTNKVLGIGIRAAYRYGVIINHSLFNGHPIVASCADWIKNIEKMLSKWNYEYFFLAIDDREYLEEIKKYFGKHCIYLDRPRIRYFKSAMQDIPVGKSDDTQIEFKGISVRNRNEDYLVELYLLAQCDSLYSSRGTGHNLAWLLNNGRYTNVEFADLGEFHYAK